LSNADCGKNGVIMQKQIISDTILIDRPEQINTQTIEELLVQRFESVLRWAIIEINPQTVKICVTYEG